MDPSSTTQPLTSDLPCHKCHYNLRSLSPNHLCPECATPVSQSIAHQIASALLHPGKLRTGALLLALSNLPAFANQVLFLLPFPYLTNRPLWLTIYTPLRLADLALFLPAVILLLKSRPSLDQRLRRLILSAALVMALIQLCALGILLASEAHSPGSLPSIPLQRVVSGINVATQFLMFLLLASAWPLMKFFAARINHRPLRIFTRIIFPFAAVYLLVRAFSKIITVAYSFDLIRFALFVHWHDLYDPVDNVASFLMYGLQFLYWLTVALIAHRFNRPPHQLETSNPTPTP